MGRTQKEKLWLIGGGIVGFVLVLIGYFMLISPQKSQTASVRASIAAAQQRNDVAKARIASLEQQNANIAKYQAALTQAELALPPTSGMPDFLRMLQALGAATQTTIASLSVSPPAPLVANAAAGSSTTSTSSTSSTSSGSGSTQGAAVYGLSINMTVTGGTTQLGDFLNQLQTVQPRAVLISSVTQTQSGTGKAGTSLAINMQAFVQPMSAAEQSRLAAAAAGTK